MPHMFIRSFKFRKLTCIAEISSCQGWPDSLQEIGFVLLRGTNSNNIQQLNLEVYSIKNCIWRLFSGKYFLLYKVVESVPKRPLKSTIHIGVGGNKFIIMVIIKHLVSQHLVHYQHLDPCCITFKKFLPKF